MPPTDWGWLITPDELAGWILLHTDDLLVLNKPPHTVCHPSRHGPWSSLIGACREYLGETRLHMPFRLDRETTGALVFARNRETGIRLQHAVLQGGLRKEYIAIIDGDLPCPLTIRDPIGPDEGAAFFRRQTVRPDGQSAVTHVEPLERIGTHTLIRAIPETGRRHQIRVHLASIGKPIAGDKLYGPDPELMLEFIRSGFSPQLLAKLPMRRHALHCREVIFHTRQGEERFTAPLSPDMQKFWTDRISESGRLSKTHIQTTAERCSPS